MDLLVDAANPEWFIWQGDQGYLPLDEVKRVLERFGNEVLPHYATKQHSAPVEKAVSGG